MAGLLSRDQILKAQDRTFMVISCPEWGGKVRMQSMSGAERDQFEESILGQKGEVVTKNLRAKLVAMSVVDKDGNLLFSKDDVMILGEKNAAALDRLFTVAQKLSGISKTDVEEMVKNSGTGQDAGSPSDSLNTLGE